MNKETGYEVRLPYVEEYAVLPDNYEIVEKRLASTSKIPKSQAIVNAYQKVFDEWLDEGIIEEVKENELSASPSSDKRE